MKVLLYAYTEKKIKTMDVHRVVRKIVSSQEAARRVGIRPASRPHRVGGIVIKGCLGYCFFDLRADCIFYRPWRLRRCNAPADDGMSEIMNFVYYIVILTNIMCSYVILRYDIVYIYVMNNNNIYTCI